MKYDFSKVKITTLDGKEVKDAHKTLADAIYAFTKDLDLVTKAIDINTGKEVELDKTEVEVVKGIVKDERAGFFAFVQKAFLDYLDSVKE